MRARIPADVEMPDRIVGGLTLRQLVIVAADVLGLWSLFLVLQPRVPLGLAAAVSMPVAVLGLAAVAVRPAGLPAERFVLHAIRHLVGSKKMVPAPEGIPTNRLPGIPSGKDLAPARLPVEGVGADGTICLGASGQSIVCKASSLNFHLRSEGEQRTLVAGFARVLNCLEGPAQFLVRSEQADAAELVHCLEERARLLPNKALSGACLEYAGFLESLTCDRRVLNRSVLVCLRDHNPGQEGRERLKRRAEDMSWLLRAIGLRLAPCDGQQAARIIRRGTDPGTPSPAACCCPLDEPVRAAAGWR